MAYMELKMWDVLEVLKLYEKGKSKRAVSNLTGRDRKTVQRYIKIAENLGWVKGRHPVDEELAGEVVSMLKPGPSTENTVSNEALIAVHHDEIKEWLNLDERRSGLRLSKVHVLLKRKGVDVNYMALYRYAVKHLNFGKKKGTVRLEEVLPGDEAQVDFGRLGKIYDAETGKNRFVHALIVTLTRSRYQYVHLSYTQTIGDFIDGIEEAFEFFGGVTRRVILDNLKAAVTKADRYNPIFSRTFAEYSEYRGFIMDAAVAASPKNKPHVERQVQYVRDNFFKGEEFINLEHAQRDAVKWCSQTAGMRIHGTTLKKPLIEFETVEKPCLSPLVKARYDTPQWASPKVHMDCHVQFMNSFYSVNFKYRGKKTDVRGDSRLVRIYIDGELVKTHPRMAPGGRSTDHENDYPKEQTTYTMRDPERIIYCANQKGKSVGDYAEHLLGGQYPWSHIRQTQKLMRLCEKYGAATVDAACARALSFDLVNVTRLEGIIKKALEKQQKEPCTSEHHENKVIQLPLKFQRNHQSFNHKTTEGI